MTLTIDPEASVRELVALGVPRAKAEQRIRELTGGSFTEREPEPGRPTVFVIALPWPMLVSDNIKHAKYASADDQVRYSRAREAIRAYGRLIAGRAAPVFTDPVSLVARVWVPDRRVRDVKNFGKVVEDALQQAAYLNDAQVKRSTWEEAGMDAKYPRAEIEVRPYQGEE